MSDVAYIGFGSNLGDRLKTVLNALAFIQSSPGILIQNLSSLYETKAVGYVEQPDFLNGAAEITTDLNPIELLRILQRIENKLDRIRIKRWGPRTIDLDILLFDDLVYESDELTIPHREIVNRRFVLQPLAEIAKDLAVAGTGRTVNQLLAHAKDTSGVRLFMTSVDVLQKLNEV